MSQAPTISGSAASSAATSRAVWSMKTKSIHTRIRSAITHSTTSEGSNRWRCWARYLQPSPHSDLQIDEIHSPVVGDENVGWAIVAPVPVVASRIEVCCPQVPSERVHVRRGDAALEQNRRLAPTSAGPSSTTVAGRSASLRIASQPPTARQQLRSVVVCRRPTEGTESGAPHEPTSRHPADAYLNTEAVHSDPSLVHAPSKDHDTSRRFPDTHRRRL